MMEKLQNITVRKPEVFKRNYQFLDAEKIIGELKYPKTYGRSAIASFGDASWQLSRRGVWKPLFEYKSNQSPYEKAEFSSNWKYHLKDALINKHSYCFKKTSLWKNQWSWFDGQDRTIMSFSSNTLSRKTRGSITILPPFDNDRKVLLALGWFIIVTQEDHSAS